MGRARIALVADIAEIPGWFGRNVPQPAQADAGARELAQYNWLKTVGISRFSFDAAAEIEMRAHGSATPTAVDYTRRFADLTGTIAVPVLSVHTTADGLVPVGNETAYAALVNASGKTALLHQAFVARSGHCAFTPGETIAALEGLIARIDGGSWDAKETPAGLNAAAAGLGPDFSEQPAFVQFTPPAFTR